MQSTYKKEEEAILAAVHVYHEKKRENESITIAEIARQCNVSYQRLYRRIQGKASKSTRQPTQQPLDPAQLNALYTYIDQFDEIGAPVGHRGIRKAANEILKRSHTDPLTLPPVVSQNWPYRFIRRNKQYTKKRRRVIDVSRQEAEDPHAIQLWYQQLNLIIESRGIEERDIWNFDETGFRIGQGRIEEILTRYPERESAIASAS